MKQKLLKTMLLLCALVAGSVSAWADSYTITFSTGSGDGTSASTSTACSAIVSEGSSYLSGNLATATKVYYSGDYGLKLGTSSAAGVVKMNLASSITPTSIVVSAKLYNSSKAATLKVNGSATQSITSDFSDLTFNITSEISYLQLESSKYCWIKSITVNYTATPAYTITPTVNDALMGSVDISGSTITATPNAGYRISTSTPYTISPSGSSTVAQSGNVFTVTPSANTTVTINFEAIPSHTVTCVADPVAGGTVEAVATSVREEETTSITATPNAGYKFTGWSITGTGASLSSTSTNPTTLTMGTADATVTASFEAVTTYPVHWSVNGVVVKTDNVEENTAITFATPASGVPAGYVFKGWVVAANRIDGTTNTDPSANYVTSANSTAEITYYAVIAVEIDNTIIEKVTITPETDNVPTSYGDANTFTEYTLDGKKFKVQQMYINNGVLQWRAAGNKNGTGIMYNTDALSNIQNIVLTYGGDDNKNFTIKVGDSENPTSGTSITPSVSDDVYTFDCSSENVDYFVLANGEYAGYLASIVINYRVREINTFNYCTTVPTATITLDAACTDGDKYYATYSNSSAFVVPADLTVSTISVAAGEMTLTDYAEGDIVKANTGVLVSAASAGAKTITLAAGGEELDGNMLKASSVAMDMTDTKFYRLTMHDGTDLGFWWGAENGAAFSIAANKAYLAVPTAQTGEVRGFSLNDGTDAITEIVNGKSVNGKWYDLSGRRVSKATKGIYIVNGKKVVK